MLTEVSDRVVHPTVLLDKKKCFANIERMVRKANKYNLAFRPHFKTHQSAEIGKWFMDLGVEEITVSSIKMASYFATGGWKNIIIAFPVNVRAITQLNDLASKCKITVLVSDIETLLPLLAKVNAPIHFFIETDTGYGRTGVSPDNSEQIEAIIDKSSENPHLNFRGFYVHNGHTYKTDSINEISAIHTKSLKILNRLKNSFIERFPSIEVQLGDTPACSTLEHFEYVDAIGPGNFVFYDLVQTNIGSCKATDIAVVVACPVVGKYLERNELIIHGGAVHFSKDKLEEEGRSIYGKLVSLEGENWSPPIPNIYISGLSQEHGTVKADKNFLDAINIGDLVYVLPVHSCLTTNLHSYYLTLDGEKISRLH